MSRPVVIRGVKIGEGMPKIIVPIVGETQEAILAKAHELAELPIHMVEWRADFYKDFRDAGLLGETLNELRTRLGDMALLFTLRTAGEGGRAAVSDAEYISIINASVKSDAVDAVDVQMLMNGETVKKCVDIIHERSAFVVGSNHEFGYTPDKDEIVSRLTRMRDMGADILKIAVMPRDANDVLELLRATSEMREKAPDRPLITMSMSAIGSITRICGEVFGSAMTFASVGTGSAPGQIPLAELIKAMDILHTASSTAQAQ